MPSPAKPTTRRLLRLVAAQKGRLALAVLCALGHVPLGLLGPVFIGRAVDGMLGPGQVQFATVAQNLLWLGATAAGAAVLQWLLLATARSISARAARQMRRQAFAAVGAAPLSHIDTHPHGDVVSRLVNDADAVAEGLLQAISQLVPGAVTILATIGFMLALSVPIALVVILITPLSILFARFIARRTARYFRAQSADMGALSAMTSEQVGALALVQAFGAEAECAEAFAARNTAYYHSSFKATFYSSVSNPGTRFINALVYAAVGVFGVLLARAGGITVGGVSAFLSYANQYTKPFNEVSSVLTQLQAALASAERLFAVMDWPPEKPDAPDAAAPAHSAGDVRAEGVYFSYSPQKPLIRDFNLHAVPGQRIALVGPTGCGKTTIINLLMRFYEVDAGAILVDDVPATAMRRAALRRLYGMVLQDTWLKAGTVAENIAYSRPGASMDEVVAAAQAAMAHGFIRRLPQGYQTPLSGGGETLSAGQRQLLCIARIMLARPDMLILDEATSSIDTRTEMLIQRALEKLMAGHTSFIVAHRLSTIESADTILVMEAGRVVEAGRHAELLAAGGPYARLYQSQFDAARA